MSIDFRLETVSLQLAGNREHEPIDHFLGRMHTHGVQVHQLTRELLDDPKSKPNPLHGAILKLFPQAQELRLVTTNFDNHFSVEASRIYDQDPEIFNAPALPVGLDFSGLVYIHGSVDGPSSRLVLTDSDFGRAYITQGWARRLLLDIYSNYVVLFIGYSHNDLVLSYLVRGLPRNRAKLYALTPAKNTEHWDFLGIEAVGYPLRSAPSKHRALNESVEAWAYLVGMKELEHEARIKVLLKGSPPLVGSEDDDYLQGVVQDPERIHFFVRNAKSVEWLLWAENRGLLDPLFTRRTEGDKRLWDLSSWFAGQYGLLHPEEALGVFERQGQVLGHSLWHDIVRHLHAERQPDSTVIRRWLPIIIEQHTPEDRVEVLEYLFGKTANAGPMSLVVMLYEYLSRPRVKLEKSFTFFDEGRRDHRPTSGKMSILGSYHWLKEALDKVLIPNMSTIAEDLARVAAQSLQRAHEINVIYDNADSEWDGASFRRSAIEQHPQDRLTESIDAVIDTCRDSLEWMMLHRVRAARKHVSEWVKSSSPMLRRLAVHGMRKDERRSPDYRVSWVVRNQLLSSILLHHEVYLLLRDAYPQASDEAKRTLLDHARRITQDNIKKNPERDSSVYWLGLLQLLAWLNQAAKSKCPLARGRMNRLKKKYPNFTMSEFPEFTHWTGGVKWGSESPVTAQGLLEMKIKDAVRLLVNFEDKRFDGPSRDGLLRVMSASVSEKPDWGLKVAGELLKRRRANSDIWNRLFWGWTEAALDDRLWQAILEKIENNPRMMMHTHEVAQLLERGLRRESDKLPYPMLEQAERIGMKLWTSAARDSSARVAGTGGWIQAAINETGGVLAEFFTMALSLRRKIAGTRWKGIPARLKRQLHRMLKEESYTGEMAQVILAGQLHFLYACDPPWAEKNVIPLLSWERGSRRAVKAWHGFLGWGQLFDELLPKLLPAYEQSFSHLESDLLDVREQFVEQVASICCLSTVQRARGKWLSSFLSAVNNESRVHFVEAVKRILWELPESRVSEIWAKWLKPYWNNRLRGRPVGLSADEGGKMAEWAPHMVSVFAEYVDKVVALPQPVSVGSFVFHMMAEKSLATKHPVSVAKYLLHVIPNSYETYHDSGELEEILDQLVEHKDTHEEIRKIMDILAGKRSSLPAKFLGRIDGSTEC